MTRILLCSDDGEVINQLTSTIAKLAEATTQVAIEGKRVVLDDVLARDELKKSLLSVSFVKLEDSGFGGLVVAFEESEKMKKESEEVMNGMAELKRQREELEKMKADLEHREKLLKDSREPEDDVVEPPDVPQRKKIMVLDDSESDEEDSDGPSLFPVRSRRRVTLPPPRMSFDIIVQLFVTLSISGNQQMKQYDFFVRGKRFWVLSAFHTQQGVAGDMAVYETEEGELIVRGMVGCNTLQLPDHVFVAAENEEEFVELCPGHNYYDAEPSSGTTKGPRGVTSRLSTIGISNKKYTRVQMNLMVLAYVGLYGGQKQASRKKGRHLIIGYVCFS